MGLNLLRFLRCWTNRQRKWWFWQWKRWRICTESVVVVHWRRSFVSLSVRPKINHVPSFCYPFVGLRNWWGDSMSVKQRRCKTWKKKRIKREKVLKKNILKYLENGNIIFPTMKLHCWNNFRQEESNTLDKERESARRWSKLTTPTEEKKTEKHHLTSKTVLWPKIEHLAIPTGLLFYEQNLVMYATIIHSSSVGNCLCVHIY